MKIKYESRNFKELVDVNNYEYYKVYSFIVIKKIIKKSKKIGPKLVKLIKEKVIM